MKKKKFYFKKIVFLTVVLCMFIGTFAIDGFAAESTSTSEAPIEETVNENDETEADENEILNNTSPKDKILFSDISRDAYEDVKVYLQIDDVVMEESYLVPSGYVMESADSLQLSERTEVREARVLFGDGKTVPITRIMKTNGSTYYAMSTSGNTGIRLEEDEKIIYVCSTFYDVKTEIRINGSVGDSTEPSIVVKDKAYANEDLEVTYRSGKYHTLTSHSQHYRIGNELYDIEGVEEGSETYIFTIPKEQIVPTLVDKDTIVLRMNVKTDANYAISVNNIAQGGICFYCSEPHDHDISGDTSHIYAAPGSDAKILLFSQSWTGGDSWYLNDLSLNGEYVATPPGYAVGDTATTTLKDGTVVTITLTGKGVRHNNTSNCVDAAWADRNKERCVYEMEIKDVQGDIGIDANFKSGKRQEIIFRNLKGITSIRAAEETSWTEGLLARRHYGYSLQKESSQNVYQAYYDEYLNLFGKTNSYNVYAYSVEDGYNPYTVTGELYYNGKYQEEIPWLGETVVDDEENPDGEEQVKPVEIPATVSEVTNALESNRRHFKKYKSSALVTRVKEDFDKVCADAGLDYAFALQQNSAANQLMELKANPYLYNLEYDLDGGNYTNVSLDKENYNFEDDSYTGVFTEAGDGEGGIQYYSWVDGEVVTNLPMFAPEKKGHVFEGWQLVKEDQEVEGERYHTGAGFTISEESVKNSEFGDEKTDTGHVFKLKAVWRDITNDKDNAPYTMTIYREDPSGDFLAENGKKYTAFFYESEYGPVGSNVVSLLFENPGKGYHLNTDDSNITIDGLKNNDDIENPDWETWNSISFYYDLDNSITNEAYVNGNLNNGSATNVVSVKKDDAIKYKITFTNPTDYDLNFEDKLKILDEVPDGLKIKAVSGSVTLNGQQVVFNEKKTLAPGESVEIIIETEVVKSGKYINEAIAEIYSKRTFNSDSTYHSWISQKSKITTTIHAEGDHADKDSALFDIITFVTKEHSSDETYKLTINGGETKNVNYNNPFQYDTPFADGGTVVFDELEDFGNSVWMITPVEGYTVTAYYTLNDVAGSEPVPFEITGTGGKQFFESQDVLLGDVQVDIIYTYDDIPLTGLSEGMKTQKLAVGALGALFIVGLLTKLRKKTSEE